MEFYPHNIPLTNVASAVSASFARTGSFIANFAAIEVTRVATASVGLNLTGSTGVAGTGAGPVPGPKGAQGNRGVTGPRGDSVYLLSSSWHDPTKVGASCDTPVPETCNEIVFGSSYQLGGVWYCDFGVPNTYYTTDVIFVEGSPLYYNSNCTTGVGTVANVGAYISSVYSTTDNVTTIISPCNTSI